MNVRDGEKQDTCYQPLNIAGGVNLILKKQDLENEQLNIEIFLVPRQYTLKEGIQLSVSLEDNQETIISEQGADLLEGISIKIDKGDIFDIIVEYKNDIYRNSFYA
ncbi:MAG: hypothetical protein J7647_22265 [Cyanobacteria bacterium SBLK]|nr:hypothetical protein [Cyanobacteria bacterium SBLK]